MKLLQLSISLLFVSIAFCQDNPSLKNIIKVNALGPINGFYEINYERVIGTKHSLKISAGLGGTTKTGKKADKVFSQVFPSSYYYQKYESNGYSIGAEFRDYASKKKISPEGLYLGAGIHYYDANETFSYAYNANSTLRKVPFRTSLLALKVTAGYQFIIKKIICIDPYGSIGYGFGKARSNDYIGTSNTNFIATIGIDIGIRF